MKDVLLVLLFSLGVLLTGSAQSSLTDTVKHFNVVFLSDFYKEKGIIFSKDYLVGIDMSDKKGRFTPTIDDVKRAEAFFLNKYNQLRKKNDNVKDFFCHWLRQYIGLIDSNNNKNIIIQLVNINKPGKINRLLGKGWENNFVQMFSDEFYAVYAIFRINLNTGSMTDKL